MELDEFFTGQEESEKIFAAAHKLVASIAPVTVRVTKSQIAFVHRKAFAWAWLPGKYLRGKHAPLVLSLALKRRDPSARWKQIVEPARGRFMHHLELFSVGDLDSEVSSWLQEAWEAAA